MKEEYRLPYEAEEIAERLGKVDDIPTKVSQLENDAQYLTKQIPSDWNASESEEGYIKNRTHSAYTRDLEPEYYPENTWRVELPGGTYSIRVIGASGTGPSVRVVENGSGTINVYVNSEYGLRTLSYKFEEGYFYLLCGKMGILDALGPGHFEAEIVIPLSEKYIPTDIRNGAYLGLTALQPEDEQGLFPMVSVRYADLIAMRNEGRLVPGQQYRIIDFVTTVDQADAKSAGHQFDVIVTADGPSVLNEKARAAISEGDTYFTEAGANLKAWQLWYCLDNDKSRFEWAYDKIRAYINYSDNSFEELIVEPHPEDETIEGMKVLYLYNKEDGSQLYIVEGGSVFDEALTAIGTCLTISSGKGVIYRMIDEWQNDVPYDFKNVVYINTEEDYAQYTFGVDRVSAADWETAEDESHTSGSTAEYNRILPYGHTQKLNAILLLGECSANTFEWGCHDICLGWESHRNSFGESCRRIYAPGGIIYDNKFDTGCFDITLGEESQYNVFGYNCTNMQLEYADYCSFGRDCSEISFGFACHNNIIGDECIAISLGKGSSNNFFGTGCNSIILGERCNNNMFGERCYDTEFGDTSNHNAIGAASCVVLGIGCRYNKTGDDCTTISLGDDCSNNSFGKGCDNIILGKKCNNNTLGDGCYDTDFSDNCEYNTLGAISSVQTAMGCKHNKIGYGCSLITLYVECVQNTIGNKSHDIAIAGGSVYNSIGNNCYEITMQDEVFEYNSIGDGCHNVHMTDHCKKLTIGQECYNLMLDSSCADSSIGQGSHDIEISYCRRTFILAGVSGISNYATFDDCFVCPVGDSFVEIPFNAIKIS